jgi:hypothetical protein
MHALIRDEYVNKNINEEVLVKQLDSIKLNDIGRKNFKFIVINAYLNCLLEQVQSNHHVIQIIFLSKLTNYYVHLYSHAQFIWCCIFFEIKRNNEGDEEIRCRSFSIYYEHVKINR